MRPLQERPDDAESREEMNAPSSPGGEAGSNGMDEISPEEVLHSAAPQALRDTSNMESGPSHREDADSTELNASNPGQVRPFT